jgi:hypothetical protein
VAVYAVRNPDDPIAPGEAQMADGTFASAASTPALHLRASS